MSINRDRILREVKRTAEANGGRPLGRLAFFSETGIKESESDWRGRFWARWNEVLRDAGFGPNKLNEGREDAVLLERFAELAVELGRLPVYSELRLKKRTDPSFPNDKTFARFGTKAQLLARVYEHCASKPAFTNLLPLIQTGLDAENTSEATPPADNRACRRFCVFGEDGKALQDRKTFSIPRRHREIALELPEKLEPIHVIRTDDPSGIEAYWHRRFQAKCTNSEWFALSAEDILHV